jgi:hypothetical protein
MSILFPLLAFLFMIQMVLLLECLWLYSQELLCYVFSLEQVF